MERSEHIQDFERHNPILGYEDGLLVGKQFGAITASLALGLPERFSLTVSDYQLLNRTLAELIDRCVQYRYPILFHKQDRFEWGQVARPITGRNDALDRAVHLHFAERPYLKQKTYLFITQCESHYRPQRPWQTFISQPSVHASQVRPETKVEFQDFVHGLCHLLQESGLISVEALTEETLLGTEGEKGIIESYMALESQNGSTVDLLLEQGQVQCGLRRGFFTTLEAVEQIREMLPFCGRYRPYETEVTTFPLGNLAPLGFLLPCEHMVNQYLFMGHTEANLEKIKKKERKFKRYAKDGHDENAIYAEDLQAYRRKLTEQHGHSIRYHMNVLAHSKDASQLNMLQEQVEKGFFAAGLRPHINTVDAKNLFYGGIPGNGIGISEELYFDTTPQEAATLLVWEGSGTSPLFDPTGLVLCDRHSGIPLTLDPLHPPKQMGWIDNLNMTVLSGTGGGKSFFANHYLRWVHGQGGHVFIIDAGKSYELQTQYHDGLFLEYQLKKPLSFNPFRMRHPSELPGKQRLLLTLLGLLVKGDGQRLGKLEESIYLGLINGYYNSKPVKQHFDSFYRFAQGYLPDFMKQQNIRLTDFDPSVFITSLLPYYQGGSLDFLLNARDQRFTGLGGERWVVFELDSIREDALLFPLVALLLMDSYSQKLLDAGKKGILKTIVFDEAWAAIAHPNLAGYIRYLVKTVRKHNGQTVFISQDPEDFLSHDLIQNAIVNNSDIKVFLDLSKYQNQFSKITKPMGFTSRQAQQLLSLNKNKRPGHPYKELAFCWKDITKVYALETSLMEKALYETDPLEKSKILKYYDESGNLDQAIRDYADDHKISSNEAI